MLGNLLFRQRKCPHQRQNKLHLIDSQFLIKEAAISLEKLIDPVVMGMTALRRVFQPQQVNESNDDSLGINSLPDEMIVKVFGYIKQNQLGQIARVCRRWNVLTQSPVLWKKVDVKFLPSHKSQIITAKSFINGLPSCVTSIRLDFTEYRNSTPMDFGELCVQLHENCPHLRELILKDSKLSNSLPLVIHLCTQFLQDVKNLVFHHCTLPRYHERVEFDGTSKIEVLDLSWCKRFDKPQFSKMPYLKVLCLYDTYVNYSWFEDDNTSFFNQLHVLDLGYTPFFTNTFLAIQNKGLNLKELYICRINLQEDSTNFFNSVFPYLKTICLSCTYVTCEAVVSLVQSCPSLENVYVDEYVAQTFAAHPFVVANKCKSGIVKAVGFYHNHNIDYSRN